MTFWGKDLYITRYCFRFDKITFNPFQATCNIKTLNEILNNNMFF